MAIGGKQLITDTRVNYNHYKPIDVSSFEKPVAPQAVDVYSSKTNIAVMV